MVTQIGVYPFNHLCRIEPERDAQGQLRRFELRDAAGTTAFGGPFCRFSVAQEIQLPAVYALTVAGQVMYVGQTTNLAMRFGARGYGEARPPGGADDQGDTNRRVNHLILEACLTGRPVDLHFLVACDRVEVENELLAPPKPAWNVAGPSNTPARKWGDALRAARSAAELLIRDRSAGEARFVSILRAHPTDGMVYMRRAQAYEQIGDLRCAALDFARAEVLVPFLSRKADAREAIRRVGF